MIELVAVAVGVGGVTAMAVWPTRDRLIRRARRDTVVVNMKSGTAFRGVLFESDRHNLELRQALVHRPGDDTPTEADGRVLLPRHDVEFLQCP